ncbi:MAG: flavin reductase [Lentisphaerae bacterium]|nr:flavin reductase [Lentisphaerota bacterium]
MPRQPIGIDDLTVHSHQLWNQQWLLLTGGDFAAGRYNTMTVSWGSLGTIWNKPFAQVVVRPSRYTREFLEQFPTFTLSAFPSQHREALKLLGTKSGRDGDKIAESGLTPCASQSVAAPSFEEASLVIECRKMYWQDMDATHFIDPAIATNYPRNDYHRIYWGEILAVSGTNDYRP